MGLTGLRGLRAESLRTPVSVTTSLRLPAWSRCSPNQIPCHVPSASLPSVIGMLSDEPRKQAFTCAGCETLAIFSSEFTDLLSRIKSHRYFFRELIIEYSLYFPQKESSALRF